MRKVFGVIGFAAGLLAATALMALAQTTAVDAGTGGSAANSRLAPSGMTDTANGTGFPGSPGANPSDRGYYKGPDALTEPANRLGPGHSADSRRQRRSRCRRYRDRQLDRHKPGRQSQHPRQLKLRVRQSARWRQFG